jgi:hypothetical protein
LILFSQNSSVPTSFCVFWESQEEFPPMISKMLALKPENLPLEMLKTGQLLCLEPEVRSALILRKGFYTDFVGPGAGVGGVFDLECTSVFALPYVKFTWPANFDERRQAFRQRLHYLEKLQEITLETLPATRAWLLLKQMMQWIGGEQTDRIPDELLAALAGVLPNTMAIARQHLLMAEDLSRISTQSVVGSEWSGLHSRAVPLG